MTFEKVLIIRLSSIGDIVLTSPIIRCIKNQKKSIIHFLTKQKYIELIKYNPNIDKAFCIESFDYDLNRHRYNLVIDLQKNLKSFFVGQFINEKFQSKYITYNKKNIEKWLLVNLKKDYLKNEHIVTRYFSALRKLNLKNDGKGLDYFINPNLVEKNIPTSFNFKQPFYVWIIGGSYENKKISTEQIIGVCSKISAPVLFLGGDYEKKTAKKICNTLERSNFYNLCGVLNYDQSAYIIKKSSLVLTNDTGFMHVASSFKKKIISFWGCTKPSLGMYPYKTDFNIQIIGNTKKIPCSKLGNRCRKKSTCIKQIRVNDILDAIKKLEI